VKEQRHPLQNPIPFPTRRPTQPVVGSGSATNCNDISGTWTDNSSNVFSLTQIGNSVSGTATNYDAVCGDVTWTISGQMTAPGSFTLTQFGPQPAIDACGEPVESGQTAAVTITGCTIAQETYTGNPSGGGSGFLGGGGSGSGGGSTEAWTRSSAPSVQITAADIVNDNINITLTGQGITSTLVVTLNAITNGVVNPFTVPIANETKGPGSYTYHFNRTSLQPGEYVSVTATWDGITASTGSNFHFNVVGYTRFTQYNTPYESQCGGTTATAYVYRTYKYNPDPTGKLPLCSWDKTKLNSQFITQVTRNGTGVSGAYGPLKSWGAIRMCGIPLGANSDGSNTFFVIAPSVGVTGTCNGKLSDGSGTATGYNGSNPQPGSVATSPNPYGSSATWACSDQILLIDSVGQNDPRGLRRAQDECPACSGSFGSDYGNTVAHIDTYNAGQGCTAKSICNDLGNFHAIRLR
jgi:hypothetical protein